jgi:hypothetical protein
MMPLESRRGDKRGGKLDPGLGGISVRHFRGGNRPGIRPGLDWGPSPRDLREIDAPARDRAHFDGVRIRNAV